MKTEDLRWSRKPSGTPLHVLCMGGGAICSAVLDHLLEEGCRVVVLDKDRNCRVAGRCRTLSSTQHLWGDEVPTLLVEDAVSSAIEILERHRVDLLVPGVPGHAAGKLAMAWGQGRLSPRGSTAVLQGLRAVLAGEGSVSMDPDSGTLISTLNTSSELCPVNCRQEGPCPITGRIRRIDMQTALEGVLDRLSIKGTVIKPVRVGDHGAITAGQIETMKGILDHLEKGDAVAIATSCSCHAIMNVFKVC